MMKGIPILDIKQTKEGDNFISTIVDRSAGQFSEESLSGNKYFNM